jgi:predicted P-loop ATPase
MADLGSKDAALATIGVWIIELSELDAISRVERSRVKSFMSRNSDRFRPPYGRRLIDSPRQCVFAGTVNHFEYLGDETGGRRFWPVTCGAIKLDSLRDNRDQLWAEAVTRYRSGEHWWLETKKLNEAAAREQDARYQRDAWESEIESYIDGRTGVTTAEILKSALNKPAGMWLRSDETRVGLILRRLGWDPQRPKANEPRVYHRANVPT